jgi:tRNA A-37 threonylcarbamoyl transferase component Bud32
MHQTKDLPEVKSALLAGIPARMIRQGVNYAPDLFLYEVNGEKIVLKDYGRKSWLIRATYGRMAIRQEARALKALAGLAGIPQYRGRPTPHAVAMTFVEAIRISKRTRPLLKGNEAFVRELEAIIAEMHRRGIVHLDMKHRSNVMTTPTGRPILIDFASALSFNVGWIGGRMGLSLFAWVDDWSVRNWKRRFCPNALSDSELTRAHLVRQLSFLWLPRKVLDLYLGVIRRGEKPKQQPGDRRGDGT